MVRYNVKYFFLVVVLSLLCTNFLFAQTEADSLKTLLAKSKPDTFRLQILNALIEISPDGVWEKYNEQLGKESEQLLKSNNNKIKNCALGFKATYINNCGFIAHHQGDIQSAINAYNQSLKINEQINHLTGIALAYNNLGFEYSVQNELDVALKYYKKAYEYYDKADFEEGRGLGLNNIAHIKDIKLRDMRDRKAPCDSILNIIPEVMRDYKKSLAIHERLKEKYGIENGYNNVGALYTLMIAQLKRCNYKLDSLKYFATEEMQYLNKALTTATEIGDQRGVSVALNNLGWHYYYNDEYVRAIEYAERAHKLATEIHFPGNMRDAAKLLYLSYKNVGKTKEALVMHEEFISLRDSILNDKNRKLSFQKQFQYEYEKKTAADSVKVAAEKEIVAAELKQEKTQKIALYAGLVLVIVFSLFITNRFRITQRQKKIIEKQKAEVIHQKELVDEKQKEILDSITYAKRLQQAILPPTHLIDKHIPSNFVLYQPKDIVAGDFYWMHEVNELVLIAAADSTGHGVPGAMVSIVCSNSLDKAVKEFKLTEPGEILDKTTELVLDTFAKSGEEIKDGMDISLLLIDKANKKIKWSGANNQLWYIDPAEPLIIKEIKANKQPVGKSDNQVPFATHSFDWQAGTIFYLLTDGYADQFGGPKGKKYKYKQLEDKLISIAHLPMQEQKNILVKEFETWRGTHEQVDDVTLIAIKLS